MATNVRAMIKIETPNDSANFDVPRTSQLPPKKQADQSDDQQNDVFQHGLRFHRTEDFLKEFQGNQGFMHISRAAARTVQSCRNRSRLFPASASHDLPPQTDGIRARYRGA